MPIDTTTTNLTGQNLSLASDKALYRGGSWANMRLAGANLSGLDLTGRSFRGADCTDTLFADAILDKCDFTGALVTLEQIEQAKSKKDVILPTGAAEDAPDRAMYEALQAQLKELQEKLARQEKEAEAAREAERLKKYGTNKGG